MKFAFKVCLFARMLSPQGIARLVLFLCLGLEDCLAAPSFEGKSEPEIRQYILKIAPIGSSAKAVLAAMKDHLQLLGVLQTNYDTIDRRNPRAIVHVDGRIEVLLGTEHPNPGSPVYDEIICRWDFNKKLILQDVSAVRQPTGP